MELKGKFKLIGDEQQVSEKFKKREIVITDESSPEYPQHISFQLAQDKCNLVDGYNVGDEVTVYFNLRGREWTSKKGELKHFNTLEIWRIEGVKPLRDNSIKEMEEIEGDDLLF